MKIALVCDWYRPRFGGIELHLEELGRRLALAGHEVAVVTPTPGVDPDGGAVRVHRIPALLAPRFGFIWTPGAFRRLKAALAGDSFDVVHSHSSIISPAANGSAYFAARLGIPAVVTVHSIWGRFGHVLGTLDRAFSWSRWPV
ncbi:MAG TPA: glycosyltransferase family 4 protein, partial [Opitutaceae bacterium]|nr:glycosyltransferase family 4 protein [Opitutaceae bacterium]